MVSAGRGSKQRCVRPLGAAVEAALEAVEVRRGPAGHTACATPASVLCRACWSLAGQLGRRHGCRLWLQPAGSRMRCNTAPLPALPAQAVAGAALAAVVAAVVSTGSRRARPSVSLGWRQRQGRRGGAVEQSLLLMLAHRCLLLMLHRVVVPDVQRWWRRENTCTPARARWSASSQTRWCAAARSMQPCRTRRCRQWLLHGWDVQQPSSGTART